VTATRAHLQLLEAHPTESNVLHQLANVVVGELRAVHVNVREELQKVLVLVLDSKVLVLQQAQQSAERQERPARMRIALRSRCCSVSDQWINE